MFDEMVLEGVYLKKKKNCPGTAQCDSEIGSRTSLASVERTKLVQLILYYTHIILIILYYVHCLANTKKYLIIKIPHIF